MKYEAPIVLARAYASYIGRSLFTVATRAGVHLKFFQRLESGHGCRLDTYETVMNWFDCNWPPDLEWPPGVQRPSTTSLKRKRKAA
jgi:hypothetical protein